MHFYFVQDGNYNKPIPAQHDERLNHPITCQEDEFIAGDNVFCDRCTQNQLLKIKQLANFVPYNEVKGFSTVLTIISSKALVSF